MASLLLGRHGGEGLEGLCLEKLTAFSFFLEIVSWLAQFPLGTNQCLMFVGTGKSKTKTLGCKALVWESHFCVQF